MKSNKTIVMNYFKEIDYSKKPINKIHYIYLINHIIITLNPFYYNIKIYNNLMQAKPKNTSLINEFVFYYQINKI